MIEYTLPTTSKGFANHDVVAVRIRGLDGVDVAAPEVDTNAAPACTRKTAWGPAEAETTTHAIMELAEPGVSFVACWGSSHRPAVCLSATQKQI